MNIWHDLSPKRVRPEDFVALIEIPKGSKNKYELDKETGFLKLDRVLYTSTHYPASYGFIPRTFADDGDPLDVLVLCSEDIYPMTLVRCKPIGVIKMTDNGAADEKIIAVPFDDPTYNGYNDISEIPAHIYSEMMHFFEVYKALENKQTVVDEVCDAEEAKRIINYCINKYVDSFCKEKSPKAGSLNRLFLFDILRGYDKISLDQLKGEKALEKVFEEACMFCACFCFHLRNNAGGSFCVGRK